MFVFLFFPRFADLTEQQTGQPLQNSLNESRPAFLVFSHVMIPVISFFILGLLATPATLGKPRPL